MAELEARDYPLHGAPTPTLGWKGEAREGGSAVRALYGGRGRSKAAERRSSGPRGKEGAEGLGCRRRRDGGLPWLGVQGFEVAAAASSIAASQTRTGSLVHTPKRYKWRTALPPHPGSPMSEQRITALMYDKASWTV